MKAYSLFFFSLGNCFFVHTESTRLLIDCGVSARCAEKALQSLGFSLSDISAILVTHEHIDHTKGLEVIAKNYHIPTHMEELSARALIKDPSSALLRELYLYRGDFEIKVGDISVRAFATPHDSAASVGYTLESGDVKIGFATDMGCIMPSVCEALSGCNASVIEANHDINMLLCGPYPYPLKQRVLSDCGHLSNDAAAELIYSLAESGTTGFLLGHLSKENNTPSLALDTVRSALGENSGVTVSAAAPAEISELIIK